MFRLTDRRPVEGSGDGRRRTGERGVGRGPRGALHGTSGSQAPHLRRRGRQAARARRSATPVGPAQRGSLPATSAPTTAARAPGAPSAPPRAIHAIFCRGLHTARAGPALRPGPPPPISATRGLLLLVARMAHTAPRDTRRRQERCRTVETPEQRVGRGAGRQRHRLALRRPDSARASSTSQVAGSRRTLRRGVRQVMAPSISTR